MKVRECSYVDFSDLEELMSEDEFEELADAVTNSSDMTFGDLDKALVSLRRMCDLIRETFDEERGDAIAQELSEHLHYNDYINLED
jgi:hypothetical protein